MLAHSNVFYLHLSPQFGVAVKAPKYTKS